MEATEGSLCLAGCTLGKSSEGLTSHSSARERSLAGYSLASTLRLTTMAIRNLAVPANDITVATSVAEKAVITVCTIVAVGSD